MRKYDLKYIEELNYWRNRFTLEGGHFDNEHYENLMMNILRNKDQSFFEGKIVADFGCGPRGSLKWLKGAKIKIGLDVLIPEYMACFPGELKTHDMIYTTTSESHIPLPDNFVDALFTINSFDHAASPRLMAKELVRIMAKGALFAASFNLYEPSTPTEPQTLKMEDIERYFLPFLKNADIRIAAKDDSVYGNMLANNLLKEADPATPSVLWLTGNKI